MENNDALEAINNAKTNSENTEMLNLIDDFGDMNIFDAEFGGSSSGIDEMILEKFQPGINENVKVADIRFRREEKWSGVEFVLQSDKGLEQSFCLFSPTAGSRKDPNTGQDIPTWMPKIMRDPNGLPIPNSENRRRASGGVFMLDEHGNKMRNTQRQLLYRNETEDEAKSRVLNDFKKVINSILGAFCKERMGEAWSYFINLGNGVNPKNWGEYLDRIITTLNEFAPKCNEEGLQWHQIPMRVKLYRKYDANTSNKRSEKFMELPKTLEKGLFLEKMGDPTKYLVKIDSYEQDYYIAAPNTTTPQAGLNTGLPNNNMPTNMNNIPGLQMPIGGMGMPNIPVANKLTFENSPL